MTVPAITPLPPAPTRADAPSDFTARADAFVAAQVAMVDELNGAIDFINQRAVDADSGASSASESSDTAGQHAQAAASQAGLAATERQSAEIAAGQAQVFAAAAGAAIGLPAFEGKGGKYVRIKPDETGVDYGTPGFEVGDILVTARDPGPTYLPATAGIYLQSAWPALAELLGTVPDNPTAPWAPVSAGLSFYDGAGPATDGLGIWMVGSRTGGLTISLDNGLTWGTTTVGSVNTSSLCALGGGKWLLFASSVGYVSTNNGASWTVLAGLAFSAVTVYATESNGAGVVIAAAGNTGTTKAMRSADNGVTWSPIDPGFGSDNILALCNDGADVWVAGSSAGKLSRSSDGGLTWSLVTPTGIPASTPINDLACDQNNVIIAVGGSGTASRSLDNGLTWAALTPGVGTDSLNGVATDGQGSWYLTGGGSTRFSANNGTSWVSSTVGFASRRKLAVGNDRTWVMSGNSGVARLFPYTYDPTTQFKNVNHDTGSEQLSAYIKATEVSL